MATNKPIKTTNQTAGGTYNAGGVTLADGDQISLQLDASGNLQIGGTISFTDPAAGPTGSPVPVDAIYDGINVGGTLRGLTGVNPSGVVFAAQMDLTSVNGVTALTGTGAQGAGSPRVTIAVDSATVGGSASLPAGTNVIGVTGVAQASTTSGQSGELIQGAVTTAAPTYVNGQTSPISLDTAGNVRVNVTAGSITVTEADMLNITGSATSAAVLSGFPKTDCTGYYTVSVQWTTITSGNTGIAEWSNDGSTWTTAVDQLAGAASFTAAGVALYPVYGKQFRLRCSVFASGSVAANTQFRGEPIVQEVLVSNFPTTVATGHGTAATAIRVELPTDGTGQVIVQGEAAQAGSVTGNPLLGGGRAATGNPSAVADGQASAVMLDKVGRQVATPMAPRQLVATQKTTISNSTAETTIITAIASTFADIVSLNFSNTGATATKVDLRDTTGGTIIDTFMVPAGDMRGQTFSVPIPQTSVNTNWTAQCQAATTAMEVTAQYIKNI